MNRISRNMIRMFSTQVKKAESTAIAETGKNNELPVHLKPYDKKKYEVPMNKIKLNSGILTYIKVMHFLKYNLFQGLK